MKKAIYYQVVEYFSEPLQGIGKRLIYTFDNEMAAHDMVEFILKNDFLDSNIGVEAIEATT